MTQSPHTAAADTSQELRALEDALAAQAGEDAASRAQLLAHDAALVAFLHRSGFEGPHYQQFITELMAYGWRTLSSWSASGDIFKRTARVGRPVPPAMLPETWAYEDRTQVVTDTVLKGSALFREHGLVRGKWSPDGRASLATYFVGAAVLAFRPVYIRWYKAHHLGQAELDHRTADTDDVLDAQHDIPDQRATDPAHTAATLDHINRMRPLLPDEQLREALGWVTLGYTHAEAAAKVGLTPKALERRLARARTKVLASGLHQTQPGEGEAR
ncbi:sigma-70 family RNA polymerase sigma factor [Streptomyces sp. 5-8]|uniref:Sigma-70 family RNA polymerase sigma factor n=1 Tax=Streptomyces musisoli TaxID=2802280 RepID=A0ABS1NUZ0_9ACTN|nr:MULTISPECIES: ECF-type sigma factor [Streptomyces]MBL1103906.1 sigma-70 family RNA polymerase sigma factor [Streptomyces musisoli]MBY8845378.1 sigma-70 family RNA polymerase sigma factor [Streptomyces sp. SP2-10]